MKTFPTNYRKRRTARDRRLDKNPATRMTASGDRGPPEASRLALMRLECGHQIAIRPGLSMDEWAGWALAQKKTPNGAVCKKCNVRRRVVQNCGSVLAVLVGEEADGGVVD